MNRYGDILDSLKSNKGIINEIAIKELDSDKFWKLVNTKYSGDWEEMLWKEYNIKKGSELVSKTGKFNLAGSVMKKKDTNIHKFLQDYNVVFKDLQTAKKYLIPDSDGFTYIDLDGDGEVDVKVDKKGKVVDGDLSDNKDDVQNAIDNQDKKKVVEVKKKGNGFNGVINILGEDISFEVDESKSSGSSVMYVAYRSGKETKYSISVSKVGDSFKDVEKDVRAFVGNSVTKILKNIFDIDLELSGSVRDIKYGMFISPISGLEVDKKGNFFVTYKIKFLESEEQLKNKGVSIEWGLYDEDIVANSVGDLSKDKVEKEFERILDERGYKKKEVSLEGKLRILGADIEFKIADNSIKGVLVYDTFFKGVRTNFVVAIEVPVRMNSFKEVRSEIATYIIENIDEFFTKVFKVKFGRTLHSGNVNGIYYNTFIQISKSFLDVENLTLTYNIDFYGNDLNILKSYGYDLPAGALGSTSEELDDYNVFSMNKKEKNDYFGKQVGKILDKRGIDTVVINQSFKRIEEMSKEEVILKNPNFAIPITKKMRTLINKEKTFTSIYENVRFKKAFERTDKSFRITNDVKIRAFIDFDVAKAYSTKLARNLGKDVGEIIVAKFVKSYFNKDKTKYGFLYSLSNEGDIDFHKMFGAIEVDVSEWDKVEDEKGLEELLVNNVKGMKLVDEGYIKEFTVYNTLCRKAGDVFINTLEKEFKKHPNMRLSSVHGANDGADSLAVTQSVHWRNGDTWNGGIMSNIFLNSNTYDNEDKMPYSRSNGSIMRGYLLLAAENYDTKEEHLEAIVRHEFGHAIHVVLFSNADTVDSEAYKILEEYKAVINKLPIDVIRRGVSEYALFEIKSGKMEKIVKSNFSNFKYLKIGSECFAECYCILDTPFEKKAPKELMDCVRRMAELCKTYKFNDEIDTINGNKEY